MGQDNPSCWRGFRADADFTATLTRAAASPSEHVEQQIYGVNFISDADSALSRQFHILPWQARVDVAHRFQDGRLRRLVRRLIFLESPHILGQPERRLIIDDIAEMLNLVHVIGIEADTKSISVRRRLPLQAA